MQQTSDEYQLIRLIQAGNTEAFRRLVDRYSGMLYTLVYRILQNREETEEVVQDSFLKAYRNLDRFEFRSGFATWIHRIAYNTAISRTRKKKTEWLPADQFIIDNHSEDDIFENLFSLNEDEKEKMVEWIFNQCNDEEKGLLNMYYISDLNIKQIAEITGLSESNVKIRLFRIRKRLAALLNEKSEQQLQNILDYDA
ncbi:MAG: RNA polymerase sigma factor [Bacteroidales bacterium]